MEAPITSVGSLKGAAWLARRVALRRRVPVSHGNFRPPPVNGGIPPEFKMANIPLWMNGALFARSLAMLYYRFMDRR